MGAMSINRQRPEECIKLNHTNSNSPRKRAAPSAVARVSRYPEVYAPLVREVHAPCRPRKFEIGSRVSVSVSASDAMGNFLVAKYKETKRSTLAKFRIFVEKGKEVIDVDAESKKPCEDSSVEEARGDGDNKDRVQQQSQSTLSFDSELKVASGEKVWGSEAQHNIESVHEYKKLLEDFGRKSSGTLQRLNFEIELNEKRREHYNLLQPKKELVQEVPQEPFVALTSEEENEVRRAFSANGWTILVSHENSNIAITVEKFRCLKPTEWLNDEVINLYLALLKEREQREPHKFLKCHFFNTFFYKKLISGPNGYDFKSVRRWTSQQKLGYSLLECDKIFVPIHQDIHWCLSVINQKDKKFQYLDSMNGEDWSVLENLAKYFVDEVKDKTGKDIDVNTWKKEFVKDLPVQKNGFVF
ncbi:hypothetical protein VNO78_04713 [Psophocarpus tetragonolobus]|uniref:Ubiquitin-like protease family profile domain-containing protein n=1 Tax=Psophocarpus tetragonolobus TaxID=3891 RepID=A0AAN9XWF1_PSOTE